MVGGNLSPDSNISQDQRRLQRAFEIFGEVVELPVADRDAYLLDRCDGDAELRQQVLDLLLHDGRATDFLTPILAVSRLRVGHGFAGRYEILEVLGEGGMGTVYKAWDSEVDRIVAIKTISPRIAGYNRVLKRLKQEGLVTRQIAHENVVRVFDIAESDATKFITMEYIDGIDLKRLLAKREKLAMPEALPIMRQICSALQAAHAKGVIHRDLKPQNIMLQNDG